MNKSIASSDTIKPGAGEWVLRIISDCSVCGLANRKADGVCYVDNSTTEADGIHRKKEKAFIEPEIMCYLPREITHSKYNIPMIRVGDFAKRMVSLVVGYELMSSLLNKSTLCPQCYRDQKTDTPYPKLSPEAPLFFRGCLVPQVEVELVRYRKDSIVMAIKSEYIHTFCAWGYTHQNLIAT
ncbi:hypothetical protein [Kluyvera intermedia]|uniref:hypothetical protein n=1 Tax=Kluyvera intermedia TaxID=61648 RepID=UPI003523AFE7